MMDLAFIAARLDARAAGRTAPRERGDHDLNPGLRPDGPLRPAAVLIGLVERDGGLAVLLTRRTDHLENHPGQISFPGGQVEARDADAVQAALRETREEVGLAPERVRVLGRLDTYVTRTGFSVIPVVAALAPPLEFAPDPHEVAEVFEVPLAFLMDPANHKRHVGEFQGTRRNYHAIPYRGYYIWGATAGMILDFYAVLADKSAPAAQNAPLDAPMDALKRT